MADVSDDLRAFQSEADKAIGRLMPVSVQTENSGIKLVRPIHSVRASVLEAFDLFKLQAHMMDGSTKTVVMRGVQVRASVVGSAREAVGRFRY